MDDQKALLLAIRENVADDTPRLAYADWLEEHGNVERAAFMRYQIEIQSRVGYTEPEEVKKRREDQAAVLLLLGESGALREELTQEAEKTLRPSDMARVRLFLEKVVETQNNRAARQELLEVLRSSNGPSAMQEIKFGYQIFQQRFARGLTDHVTLFDAEPNPLQAQENFAYHEQGLPAHLARLSTSNEPVARLRISSRDEHLPATLQRLTLEGLQEFEVSAYDHNASVGEWLAEAAHCPALSQVKTLAVSGGVLTRAAAERFAHGELKKLARLDLQIARYEDGALDSIRTAPACSKAYINVRPVSRSMEINLAEVRRIASHNATLQTRVPDSHVADAAVPPLVPESSARREAEALAPLAPPPPAEEPASSAAATPSARHPGRWTARLGKLAKGLSGGADEHTAGYMNIGG